ncbi:MAG: EVE domain-containing protein [Pseudomonadales bacterium]
MQYWLLKTEPDAYSIDDLARQGQTPWDGIRNFQARNFIRDQMQPDDEVLIYHSSCSKVGIAGHGRVASQPYADPAQFDETSPYYDPKATVQTPKWFVVDIAFVAKTEKLLPLKALKACDALAELALFKQSRLSVVPVSAPHWAVIKELLTG